MAYIRFETEPGRQAQVDFGDFAVTPADHYGFSPEVAPAYCPWMKGNMYTFNKAVAYSRTIR